MGPSSVLGPPSSDLTVRVDSVTESDWNALLPQFADASIYQTWAYGAVSWGEKQLSHLVLKRDGEVVAAAQLRLVRVPLLNTGIAYLRWGPLWRLKGIAPNAHILDQMLAALRREYVERRGLLLRILPNVFQEDAIAAAATSACHQHGLELQKEIRPYRTIRLDLSPSLDELRKSFDPKWRNKLNGAERNELSIVEGTTDDLYQAFLGVYHEMMARKAFETTVDVREFGQIQSRLPQPCKMRIFLCQKAGKTLNALVVAPGGDTAIYLLGATSDEGTKAKGSYLLHWRAIQWLKEQGTRWYDLGGINPEKNPGVYEFKKGLSGQEDYHLGRFECRGSWFGFALMQLAERLTAYRRR